MKKNKYGLDQEALEKILESQRSKEDGQYKCVYCRESIYEDAIPGQGRKKATIEHLYPPGNAIDWVCFCCNNCNSSHQKPLREWFKDDYCKKRDINENTVSNHIKRFLSSGLKEYFILWLDWKEHDLITGDLWRSSPTHKEAQFIKKSDLPPQDKKRFDGIAKQINKQEFLPWYTDRDPNYARYEDHGEDYEYWLEGDLLFRRKYRA